MENMKGRPKSFWFLVKYINTYQWAKIYLDQVKKGLTSRGQSTIEFGWILQCKIALFKKSHAISFYASVSQYGKA